MTTQEIFLNFIINIAASAFFTFFLYFTLRPNLKISPFITTKLNDNNNRYFFKIINRSFFPAYDLRFELYLRELLPKGNDQFDIIYKKLNLNIENYKMLSPTTFNKNVAKYAIIISTSEDIKSILDNPIMSLELIVSSTHGLSAFSKIFKMNFSMPRVIKSGIFKFGNNLDVE